MVTAAGSGTASGDPRDTDTAARPRGTAGEPGPAGPARAATEAVGGSVGGAVRADSGSAGSVAGTGTGTGGGGVGVGSAGSVDGAAGVATDPAPLVGRAEIEAAAGRIADLVHRTPTVSSRVLGEVTGFRLAFKAELFQKTGSFKARGVLNALATLPREQAARGLVTLSAGNHAAALAMAAAAHGLAATVVMPVTAAPAKVAATAAYGGNVVLTERPLMTVVEELRAERGLTLVHPFDDPAIIAGAGTVGLEIVEDVPDVDVVVVPVGGGGLVSGVAAAVKALRPAARVVGVEPEGAAVMRRSLDAGRPVSMDAPMSTIADGLTAPFAGEHTYRHVVALVDEVVTVGEEDLARAVLLQMERTKLYAEPAGAVPLAALLAGAVDITPGASVVCVVSGGNTNRDTLRTLL